MRFHRGLARWMLGVGAAAGLLACQYDYPLPPTLCDRWCAASEPELCRALDPAECVIACEEERSRLQAPMCDARFLELIECLEGLSVAEVCARNQPGLGGPPFRCAQHLDAYLNCWAR